MAFSQALTALVMLSAASATSSTLSAVRMDRGSNHVRTTKHAKMRRELDADGERVAKDSARQDAMAVSAENHAKPVQHSERLSLLDRDSNTARLVRLLEANRDDIDEDTSTSSSDLVVQNGSAKALLPNGNDKNYTREHETDAAGLSERALLAHRNAIDTVVELPNTYVGSFRDKTSARALRMGPHKYGYTVASCSAACAKYQYFAVQAGSWCCCDNSRAHATKYGSMNDCKPLGGGLCNALYKNVLPTPAPTKAPTKAPTPAPTSEPTFVPLSEEENATCVGGIAKYDKDPSDLQVTLEEAEAGGLTKEEFDGMDLNTDAVLTAEDCAEAIATNSTGGGWEKLIIQEAGAYRSAQVSAISMLVFVLFSLRM